MITSKVKKITKKITRKVYDIVGMPNGNFVCNRGVISNCDEAIRFASACITGNTLIKTPVGNIPIKLLENKSNFEVYSYNEQTKKEEIKLATKCLKIRNDIVYKLETEDRKKIQATKDHKFLTAKGWRRLEELKKGDDLVGTKISKIKSIKRIGIKSVYDIFNVNQNNNYIGNNLLLHNSDWNRRENKELKKKLAQVRTKHLFYILCFPLKIYKVEKTYLESFTNYWVDLFARGVGAIYVKDKNPIMDSWRMKDFQKIGSYTEFTNTSIIRERLKKHPNFWQIVKFPKPPQWLYARYLTVRERNIYDDENVLKNVSKEDIHNALLILSLRDIMMHDDTLSMNRILLHIKNQYDINLTKGMIQGAVNDAKQLITKVRESALEP